VLSAMAHGADPDRTGVLDVLVDALATIETERAVLYSRLVLAALPEAARSYMEALMSTGTYEYQSEFTRRLEARGEARGKASGEAEAVLTVLETRGVEVPDDVRVRITQCSDLDQLTVWLRRAVTAASAHDLFG